MFKVSKKNKILYYILFLTNFFMYFPGDIIKKYKDMDLEDRPSRSYTLLNDLKLIEAMSNKRPPYSQFFFTELVSQVHNNNYTYIFNIITIKLIYFREISRGHLNHLGIDINDF